MVSVNTSVKFLVNLAKAQSILTRRFDRGLGGLGFNEFLVLISLHQADEQKMRRVDLAEKIGMTASGVTRILLPMEKVHLIKSGPVEDDARVRFVTATPAGKEKLSEALERIDLLMEEVIPSSKMKEVETFSNLLLEIGGKALMV
jgi:DNA-binding MarR family transcriptional regulator